MQKKAQIINIPIILFLNARNVSLQNVLVLLLSSSNNYFHHIIMNSELTEVKDQLIHSAEMIITKVSALGYKEVVRSTIHTVVVGRLYV